MSGRRRAALVVLLAAGAPPTPARPPPAPPPRPPQRPQGLGVPLQPDGRRLRPLRPRLRPTGDLPRLRPGGDLPRLRPTRDLSQWTRPAFAPATSALEMLESAIVIVMWSWNTWAASVAMPSLKIAKASRWPPAAWQ